MSIASRFDQLIILAQLFIFAAQNIYIYIDIDIDIDIYKEKKRPEIWL